MKLFDLEVGKVVIDCQTWDLFNEVLDKLSKLGVEKGIVCAKRDRLYHNYTNDNTCIAICQANIIVGEVASYEANYCTAVWYASQGYSKITAEEFLISHASILDIRRRI